MIRTRLQALVLATISLIVTPGSAASSVQISGQVSPPVSVRFDLRSLSRRAAYGMTSAAGSFHFDVPPDYYALHVLPDDPPLSATRVAVDARNGNVSGIVVPVGAVGTPHVPKDPPIARLVSIGAADAEGIATVRGQTGSVAPAATVRVANLQTGQTSTVVSEADGSFETTMFAPAGSFLEIKHDPAGRYLTRFYPRQEIPPGTIMHVPGPAGTIVATSILRPWNGQEPPFDPVSGGPDGGQWFLSGSFDTAQWNPGQAVQLGGTITLISRDFKDADISALRVKGNLQAEQVFDSNGRHLQMLEQFMSSTLTPVGLPITGSFTGQRPPIGNFTIDSLRRVTDTRVEGRWSVAGSAPGTSGHFRLITEIEFEGLPPPRNHTGIFRMTTRGLRDFAAPMRIVKVGTPQTPRMLWMLALNDLVNGQRGALANEDRGLFRLSTLVLTSSGTAILPPVDPRSGAPIEYRLEPFAPIISNSTGTLPDTPQIPLAFPSGSLTVRVERPDGSIDDLGSAGFVQSRHGSPHSSSGLPISGIDLTAIHVSDFYQLTTLDPRFTYTFSAYGLHRVHLKGWIEDIWGNRIEAGGTYEIEIAHPLDLETATLPGVPLKAGAPVSPTVTMHPPVPADISVSLAIAPDSDSSRMIRSQATGRASRFGTFAAAPMTAAAPGEYRMDVTARYTDREGRRWAANQTWGGVIESVSSPLIVHGRRGFQNSAEPPNAWLNVRTADRGANHLMFPYHSGDVMWMEKDDVAAAMPAVTLQDTEGAFADRVRAVTAEQGRNLQTLEERIRLGEIPLQSSCFENACYIAYGYASVQRPGVRVREFISQNQDGYWRFFDHYQLQLGTGAGSDLPNDFKFQFGGAVVRDPQRRFFDYGGYASLWVMLPFTDARGGRIFPPFQGDGGGPDGGPLFRLKGKDVDLFFHLTGLRPGAVLQRGERISFAGYSAPPLPSKIEILVTSPSGSTRTIGGQASSIGHFYEPLQDFTAGESGVWKAKLKIVFDTDIGGSGDGTASARRCPRLT